MGNECHIPNSVPNITGTKDRLTFPIKTDFAACVVCEMCIMCVVCEMCGAFFW